jgi:hypothetical protein
LRNKVPLQVFDIVQFSRSCSLSPFGGELIYFTRFGSTCQALFSFLFKPLPTYPLFDQEQFFESRVLSICFALTFYQFRRFRKFAFACPSALSYYTALGFDWQVLFRIFRKFGSVSAFSPVFSCKAFTLLVNSALGKTAGFFEANFPYIFHPCLTRSTFFLPYTL